MKSISHLSRFEGIVTHIVKMLPLPLDLSFDHFLLLGVVDRLEEVCSGLVHIVDTSSTKSLEERENGFPILDALGGVDHGNGSALVMIRFEKA